VLGQKKEFADYKRHVEIRAISIGSASLARRSR